MTQEDKELLLKDLCARLPYGVIVDYKENEFEIPHWKITTIYPDTFNGWIGYDKRVGAGSESGSRPFNIGEVKPYLRPMSSMTEEEKKELQRITDNKFYLYYDHVSNFKPSIDSEWHTPYNNFVTNVECNKLISWLDKKHFDHRTDEERKTLIEKGLALKAPKNMYKEK